MTHDRQREAHADAPPSEALCRRVASLLSRGGLVALPTETVYGIGVRADHAEAMQRLIRSKGRPLELGLTWHVGAASALERFPRVSSMARRLIARYWPGPLTLVLPGIPPGLESAARDGWTGVRMPAHQATSGILAALEFPVVLSSANRHGAAPACDADEVERIFGDEIDLLIDGGRARLAEGSCVLRVGPGAFDMLREGLYDLGSLRRTAGLRIGFVCTGNTCRSPMAEGLARKLIATELGVPAAAIGDFGFELGSMGVFASAGSPASPLAVKVMREEDVDLGAHSSRPALTDEVRALDRVYCMTRSHREALVLSLPPGQDKNIELLDPRGEDIPDPMGGTRTDYRSAADRIQRAIEERLADWV